MLPDAAPVLLDLLRDLCAELGRSGPISLDSRLREDLGIDSLGRMELLLRLQRHLGVSVPDDAALQAETPRDLLALLGDGVIAPRTPIERPAVVGGAVRVPTEAATLNEVLAHHAAFSPTRTHLVVLDGDAERHLSYGELEHSARRVAGALADAGVAAGERVALMLPTCAEYFPSFLGILLAGAVPVPIYPPASWRHLDEHMQRQRHVLTDATVVALITVREAEVVSALLPPMVPSLRRVLLADEVLAHAPGATAAPVPEDLALLQYTSGSTSNPKGVALSHRNILANIRAIGRAQQISPDDVCVSWLPLYHDMGLIGAWLGSLYHGCRLVVMSPLMFLAAPQRWLQAMSRHGGTVSTAPNFAYEICASRLEDDVLAGLDLSRWRIAMNGAEAVSARTIQRFTDRFAPFGFTPSAFAPVYGLAENCVALTMPPAGEPPRFDTIDRAFLQDLGEARPAEGPGALLVAACGHPIDGHEVRVVLPGGGVASERQQGSIQFRGPSATRGYLNRPEANAALFDGTWLNTGDLGYIAGGHLHVTGRSKDLVVRGGRNVHPQEIEELAGEVEGVRKGCVAVFATTDPSRGTERLVIMAETRRTDGLDALRARVRDHVAAGTGEIADEIVLVPPHTIPKTSSGKIQRNAARQRFEGGILQPGRSRWSQWLPLAGHAASVAARRAWRAAGDWAYAAWFFVLLGTLQPLAVLVVMLSRGVERRRRIHAAFMRTFLRLAGIRVTVRGAEHLAGHCLCVVNHQGFLDTILMTSLVGPGFFFTPKGDLQGDPLARTYIGALGYQFVDRLDAKQGVADLEPVKRRLLAGESAVVYPEGIFFPEPGLRYFFTGAFTVACETGTPVVPVAIAGARRIWPGETRFVLFRRGSVEITVMPPIRPTGTDWSAAVRLMRESRAAILAHCGEFDAGDRP